ncbi:hypothetical protein HK101_004893, partial [Irineochytrium annulatum]
MEYVDVTPPDVEKNATNTFLFPVYRTHSLTVYNESITRLVIVLGGNDRRAWVTYGTIWVAPSPIAAVSADTVVVTPYFTCQEDYGRPEAEVKFDCNGWVTGFYAIHPMRAFRQGISSFGAIDSIVTQAQSVFPSLKRVV